MNTVLSQYASAIDLYKHEDSLNWSKLHNMFYANAGLLAILGLVDKSGASNHAASGASLNIVVFVGLLGILVSLGFLVAIWSGIYYLRLRKDAVVKIELQLAESGGVFVVYDPESEKRKWHFSKVSPTTYVLGIMPVVLCLLWIIILSAVT